MKNFSKRKPDISMNKETALHSLFSSSDSALILIDRKYIIIDFNETAAWIFKNLKMIDLEKGTDVFQSISEEHREKIDEIFADEDDIHQYSMVILDGPDDEEFWFEVRFIANRAADNNGTIESLWLQFTDVSERKTAIDQIAKSEIRFTALVKESFDLIAILNRQGKFEFVNDSIEKVLGFKRNEIIGKAIFDFIHKKDRDRFELLFNTVITDNSDHFITEIQFKDNYDMFVYLEVGGRNLIDDPDINGIILNARDITYRKQIEVVLTRINRQRELIMESIADGVFGVDPDRKITFVNLIGSMLSGMKENELIGEHDMDIVTYLSNDGKEFEESPVASVLQKGEASRFPDAIFKFTNGLRLPVDFSVNPIKEGDSIQGAVITFHDITERKIVQNELQRAKVQAEQANTYKSEF